MSQLEILLWVHSISLESGRNGFTRGGEHLDYWEACDEDKSVLWLHSVHHHHSRQDVNYSMRVTGAFKEPLDRQIMERVQIQNFKGPVLMNRRSEMGGVRVDSELKVLAEIKFKCRGAFTCSQDKNRNHHEMVNPSVIKIRKIPSFPIALPGIH